MTGLLALVGFLAAALVSTGTYLLGMHAAMEAEAVSAHADGEGHAAAPETFISMKGDIQQGMMAEGHYACCLAKPCTYCIEKSPGHGEGASCHCLDDVMNGRHPCGECIGEILEGHGNPFLAEYFATAIAEETGEIEALRRIVEEKYGVPAGRDI